MIVRAPAIPASLAAIVTFVGLALVYWSLTGLGLLRSAAQADDLAAVPSGTGSSSSLTSGATKSLGGEKRIGQLRQGVILQ